MACQSQRGLPLFPTKDHISSISASPARSISQATSFGFNVRSSAVFTDSSTLSFFLSSRTQHGVGTDMQRSRCIAHPTGIEAHIDDCLLHFRQAPSIAIVEKKTSLGTEGVLAQVALCSPGRFPAFDDLVTLTVRA